MIKINIEGMSCEHCSNSVKKAIESVEGTSEVVVDLNKKIAEFNLDDDSKIDIVKKAVKEAGFKSE